MPNDESALIHSLIRDALAAVLVGLAFPASLLATNAFGLGSLISDQNEIANALIVVLGGAATLAPALWAIAVACLKET